MSNPRVNKRIFWILGGFSSVGTLLLYGDSLKLPFFFDDFVHYPFVENHTFWQIWTTTDQLIYYRPLNFAIWRLTYLLAGSHNSWLDHGLNLLLHAGNGVLVGWLSVALWQDDNSYANARTLVARSFISTTLYLIFPFSYQAVPWIGAMSHLLVTHLVLWSVATFWHWRQRNQFYWLIVSVFLTVLALFTHENGILIVPLVLVILFTTPNQTMRWSHWIGTGLLYSLPALFWLPIRWTIHQDIGGDFFPNNLEGLLQNSMYFIQGAAFPITQFGGWLHRLGGNDLLVVFGLSGVALGLSGAVQFYSGSSRRGWLPWLWWILASLPAILLLRVNYVIDGPRLLMVASVGIAWLWADAIVRLGDQLSFNFRSLFAWFSRAFRREGTVHNKIVAIKSLGAVVLFAVAVIGSGRFLRVRMAEHLLLGGTFRQAISLTQDANEAGETAVFINAPSWVAPIKSTFALGHEGVLFWPDYVDESLLLHTHTGQSGCMHWVRVDALRPELNRYYGVSGHLPDWKELSQQPVRFFLADYGDSSISFQDIGSIYPASGDTLSLAQFSPHSDHVITLHDVMITPNQNGWNIRLIWSTTAPHPTATVFLHLVDAEGQLLAQADGEPLRGSYPFSIWQPGFLVIDQRLVTSVHGADAIKIGVYNWMTGERELAITPDKHVLPDNALTVPID
jgi:hypothetical protein